MLVNFDEGLADRLAQCTIDLLGATKEGLIKWAHFKTFECETWSCKLGGVRFAITQQKASININWTILNGGNVLLYATKPSLSPDFLQIIKDSNPVETTDEEFGKGAEASIMALEQALTTLLT